MLEIEMVESHMVY